MVTLVHNILSLWENPNLDLDNCILERNPGPSDANDVQAWVDNIKFTKNSIQALARSSEIEVEMPFFYIKDEFLDAFIGVYLYNIAETMVEGFGVDFSTIHFVGFLISDRFLSAFSCLQIEKQWIVFLVLSLLVSEVEKESEQVFSSDDKRKLKMLLPRIISQEMNKLLTTKK